MDPLENRFRNRKSVQIAYFKAYKGHMHNPGMGIISMAISDHMVTGYSEYDRRVSDQGRPFSLTREMLKEVIKLPYIDNIYLRVGWKDVQKTRGRLDLIPEIDMAIEEAKRGGKSWGLRIMQCSPSNPSKHLLPDFLADKLPMLEMEDDGTYGPKPKLMPAYTEEYLKYWEEMLRLLGEKFDSDHSLEYADVSGYGYWGEGHNGGLQLNMTREEENRIIEKLLSIHKNAFPQTPMVMNLHLSEFYEAGQRMIQEGCWVRRDSYYGWFQACQAEDGQKRRPDAAMIFETIMPGLGMEDAEDPSFRHSFLDTADSMCDFGANYATVGFNPLDTLYADHMVPQVYDAFKSRLGYRLRPSIVWKLEEEGQRPCIVLGMVNDGCANPPGNVVFQIRSGTEKEAVVVNGGEFSKRMVLVEIPLPVHADKKVCLTMALVMGKKEYPVSFAADVRTPEAPYELLLDLRH